MQKKQLFIPILAISLMALVGIYWLYLLAEHITVPHEIKLIACTNSTLNIHLKVPNGHNFSLVLGTSKSGLATDSSYKFSGRIYISDETLTTIEIPIGSDYVKPCNWLHDLPGFILTSGTNCADLSRFIRPQVTYDFKIVFDHPPPSSATIWLCWLQAGKNNNN